MPADIVLLHHTLPDATSHYDWLTSPPGREGHGLVAFRLEHRLDASGWDCQQASRLPEHRRLYLTYEGDLTGDRGHVRRVARGICLEWVETPDQIRTTQVFGPANGGVRISLLVTRLEGGDFWEVRRVNV
ncbi:MAG: hypothetical protein HUU18_03520 [Phycisphaerales bacterium]|mgnify:CR=1 FL=1|nr:hypothetical protein [Phycisphaerales bacterium]